MREVMCVKDDKVKKKKKKRAKGRLREKKL